MEIHETGYAWRFIRTLPRYLYTIIHAIVLLGASMTLVGMLPPLCDNGSMLVDGGYRRVSIMFLVVLC
jgi:lysophospholipid hydrolase